MAIFRIRGERLVEGRRRPLESFVDSLHDVVQPRTAVLAEDWGGFSRA